MEVESRVEHEERVSPLELFFDLVFVFAITQVTSLLSDDPTWTGLARGVLVLGALWWAWAAYAWLTNTLDTESGAIRIAMFAAMSAMLVVALTVPGAFDEHAVLFGVAYFAVRILHVVLYALAGRGNPELLRAVLSFTPTSIVGPALIISAAVFDGAPQGLLWAIALTLDYIGPLFSRGRGWTVSAGHFAERHGLIVIIALGESVVALGVGAGSLDLDAGVITAAVLGIVVIAALWWAYFDVIATIEERMLSRAEGVERATLARDLYSYLHLPMVSGIVLFALGLKKTLGDVGEPLEAVPAFGLCCGLALYMLAHVVSRLRIMRAPGRGRPVATGLLVALGPVAVLVPALVALALVAAVCTGLIVYEVLHYREARARIRQTGEVSVT